MTETLESRQLVLIYAASRRGVIGLNGGLPWRIPEDLAHFRRCTVGHAVIMGRRTFESIGRPLRDRTNIVVSRRGDATTSGRRVGDATPMALPGDVTTTGGHTSGDKINGTNCFDDLDKALEFAWSVDDRPHVIGGASIYAATLSRATELIYTEIDVEYEGDTFFPAIQSGSFVEVSRTPGITPGVTFINLKRSENSAC